MKFKLSRSFLFFFLLIGTLVYFFPPKFKITVNNKSACSFLGLKNAEAGPPGSVACVEGYAFGGTYNQGVGFCLDPNPYTGSCTCPPGFNPRSYEPGGTASHEPFACYR
ncbi:MAG: hypothetical protein KC733_12085 [Candidatus Omnitrophica bacterium]|nr:hypothetical protein [Candidatus Omnitrophota bacterium]